MIESTITFFLSNPTLTFIILGVIAAILSLIEKPKPLKGGVVVEAFFSYFLLFAIGFSYFYNFVMHVFFGQMVAQFIGWAQSPFQAEVGFASLGFAIVGVMAFRRGFGFRAATVIAPAFFLWGAAGGHIYQMIEAHNFAPGNAGIVFWTDIFIPLISFVLLWLQYKFPSER